MMNRIPSLRYSSFNARSILRTRFAALPAMPNPHVGLVSSDQEAPRDADMLRLLLDTAANENNNEATSRREYMRIQSESGAGLPDYDEALARGWFRTIWGRTEPAVTLRDYYLRRDVPYAEELRHFVYWLSEIQYRIAQPGTYASAAIFEDYVSSGAMSGHKPPIQTPAWIAARLWDVAPTVDLTTWAMRWALLDWVPFVPSTAWSQQDAQRFREAALFALSSSTLPEWHHVSMAKSLGTNGDIREEAPVEVPLDLLGRFLIRAPSSYGTDLYESHALCAFMRVLALELAHVEAGPVPSVMAEELVVLAMRHPDLCQTLVDYCLQAPQTLADLIFCPRAAGLVCYLVATWNRQFQVDREQRNEAADTVQASLLADCLVVLRHHLVQDAVSPVEYARLLIVMQQHDCDGHDGLPLLPIGLECLCGLPIDIQRQVRHALVQAASINKTNSPEFAVLLKAVAAINDPFTPAEADTVASTYQQAFSATERVDMQWVDTAGAAVLAQLAMDHESLKLRILRPLDLKAELVHRPGDAVSLGLMMREQIRVLSRAVAGYPESVPEELVAALAAAIQSGASNRPDKYRVDAFTFQLDAIARGRRGPRLESDLIEAVNRLEMPAQQGQLVKALLAVEDPLVLALLLPRAPKAHREAIRARLEVLTPEEASPPAFVTQVPERVQVFLDAGLPDIANMYLQHGEEKLRGKKLPALALQTLEQQLQLHYISGAFDSIESATIPDGLPPEHKTEAQRTLDFFRALVFLKKEPPAAKQAVGIFRRLYQAQPLPAYAVNLLAASITNLLGDNLFRTLIGEEARVARSVIDEADRAIPSASALSDMTRAIHLPNCAAMLLAIGRPSLALSKLKELAITERTVESVAYEAVASARLGESDRARALIQSGKERYGAAELLMAAENHIDHSAGFGAAPRVLSKQETAVQLRSAMRSFMELSASEQAEVLVGPPLALENFLTAVFQDALAAFHRTLSFLKLDRHTQFHEDDFNGIVAELVEGRLEGNLGWQAHEQSPGGYTQKGNAGRRDFVIRRRGVDITVFEALKSAQPNDTRIVEHFHKLLGYSSTNILFHVTYSQRVDVTEMRAAVEEVAKKPPPGTVYLGLSNISADGARPGAVRGAYRRDGVDITVIFFVIDMLQANLRAAVGAPSASVSSN